MAGNGIHSVQTQNLQAHNEGKGIEKWGAMAATLDRFMQDALFLNASSERGFHTPCGRGKET